MNYIKNIIESWKQFLLDKNTFYQFLVTIIFSIIIFYLFRDFLVYIEQREQTLGVFNDPFFFTDPMDFSIPIFLITYGTIGFFIIYHLSFPLKLMYFIQMTLLLLLFRTITLFLFRFDAPEMIVLKDPILNTFIYQLNDIGEYNQHDLFFSGHTANLFLASILFKNKNLKKIFLFFTFLMAVFIVLQHAHYSIDVIFAPLFSCLALYLHKKYYSYLTCINR